ncbi:hypothetical protein [Neptunomonas japonica]|uniref:Uncharacterized protein n=1 Tax=Neptunomonas japonica JAMM 1380 TaxID=1441457 RepID=A0A7R6SUK7_9GAMM|nr:hypothetical protein [Neptunomonas japonica]BBB28456.1 conserved hypothetical protein [Neptunomonas japonica JAMM 1380]
MPFTLKKQHYRLILATALVMLSGWILSATYLYIAADNIAKNEATKTARLTARQAAMTIQPYLLAEDIISLNFFLNSLTEAPQVKGVAIFNKRNKLIARAGENNGAEQQVILGNQQTPMGTLKLYTGHQSEHNMLTGLLWQVAILSAISFLATLITLWLSLKQLNLRSSTFDENSNIDTSNSSSSDAPALDEEVAEQPESFYQSMAEATSEPYSERTEGSNDDQSQIGSEPDTDIHSTDETLDNNELVELLRPDSTERMPHFKPAPMQSDNEQANDTSPVEESTYELEDSLKEQQLSQPENTQEAPPLKPNPLRAHERAEEQLDLYSLEHQLELSLQPKEAAYLFYIDATTGHADYVEPEEHSYLLQTYEHLIKKVSAIYGGSIFVNASGDLQVFFDDQDEEDGHGVHALCAAKLFTLLYRAFNQARIKSFKPVLNLHMAIVRGNRDKFNLIKEEALFLTRTTQTNELISHTALTEAKQLKSTLLSTAQVRREDEDKVLILSLTPSYQALLTKQATHLLKAPSAETLKQHS